MGCAFAFASMEFGEQSYSLKFDSSRRRNGG
jgi:hypothetical protein